MVVELDRLESRTAVSPAPLATPRFGPVIEGDQTAFRLWAPRATSAYLELRDHDSIEMQRAEDGFFVARVADCAEGTPYQFRIGELVFPDLASRRQEASSTGWSIVCEPLRPSGRGGPLRPWYETILCEVHVGTVTPEGTFRGLRDRLEHFRDAGYTALEVMPVNTFPGTRNWGYDGTLIFAPHPAYGTPEDLRSLVDRAHEVGLCVVLDVVYNHFGEHNNFVQRYAPEWFNPDVKTPWGPGINFNEPMVQQFYFENAAMWLSEYDFDGLRFDSVHEIKTERRDQFLGDLAKTARAAKSHAKLIIENMDNTATWLDRTIATNEPVNFTAQWNDDIHHVLTYLVTGDGASSGYSDHSKDPYADLEKGLADGFIHDGEADGESDGRTRGEPGSRLPPDCFVTYVQNHDQIGNRADGKRLPDRISAEKLDFVHFVSFLAPQIPLFFMGEEAHLRSRFPFFVDLPADPARAKRDDRYRQMREIFHQDIPEGGLPDPNDPATFEQAKLPWGDFVHEECRAALGRFRQLGGYRRDLVLPLMATPCTEATTARQGNALIVNWRFEAGTLSMALNPTDMPMNLHCLLLGAPVASGEFSQLGEVLRLGPWAAVAWASK